MSEPYSPTFLTGTDTVAFYVPVASSLSFHGEGGEVGKLTWEGGTFRFAGNADESAKVFFDALKRMGVGLSRPESFTRIVEYGQPDALMEVVP